MARRSHTAGTSPLTEVGHLISWHRRKLAVLAAMSAAAFGITAASPPDPPTTDVVVAAHRLTGGHQLTTTDLEVRRLPAAAVPVDAVTDPDPLLGRTLVAPLSAGSVLTELSVLGPRPTTAPGMVIAPIRIADPAVITLLRVGDRIDVLASVPETGGGTRVVAEQVRIVTIPGSDAESSPMDGGDEATLLLVEVTPEQATVLADAAASSQITVLM